MLQGSYSYTQTSYKLSPKSCDWWFLTGCVRPRKQPTFHYATFGIPVKWHLRNKCRNSNWCGRWDKYTIKLMVYLLGNKVGIFAWKWGNMANSEQKMALTATWKWTRHYGSVHLRIVVVDQLWMHRNSKKWYFSRCPSIQIPLLSFKGVTIHIPCNSIRFQLFQIDYVNVS